MNDIDVTVLRNTLPKERWKCPHCGETNTMGEEGAGTIAKHGKYIENCAHCNALHFWKLKLSDDAIAETLKKEAGIE